MEDAEKSSNKKLIPVENVEGQQFERESFHYKLDDETLKIVFPLTELQYYKLMKSPSKLSIWANGFLAIVIVFFVIIAAKLLDHIANKEEIVFEMWELLALVISFVIWLGLRFFDTICPNDRKNTSKQIKEYFQKANRENEK